MPRPEIIFENEKLVVINKAPGLLSVPDREGKEPSLKSLLREMYGQIFVVHRLDRDTSGLNVFAKTEDEHRHLSMQFESRQTEKIYRGLCLGSFAKRSGTIDAPIAEHPGKKGLMCVHRKGKEALTDYEVLEEFRLYSWTQFRIHTGRTHQIRVHMKHLGHPLACDELYGDGKPVFLSSFKHRYKLPLSQEQERPILGRLALHAFSLTFTDSAGRFLAFEAPLPRDLKATLSQLEKSMKKI